jgi:RHS repeat-associated protein
MVTCIHGEYDANGLRTKKVENSIVTRFVLDGASVFEELDAAGTTTTSYLNNPTQLDEILSFQTGGATYYPLTDALGSVVAVTDSSGTVVRSNSYDVYGARTTSGTGPALAFGFTGREQDSTGLNYNRDRYLDPATGRWGQPDRAGMVDGPNLYQYARGQPTVDRDPTGRWVAGVGGTGAYQSVAGGEADWYEVIDGHWSYGWLFSLGLRLGIDITLAAGFQAFYSEADSIDDLSGAGLGVTADLVAFSLSWTASVSCSQNQSVWLAPPSALRLKNAAAFGVGWGPSVGVTGVLSYSWVIKFGNFPEDWERVRRVFGP